MISLLFIVFGVAITAYMLFVIVFVRRVAGLRGDMVESGQLSMGRVRYASYLIASSWRPPTAGLRVSKVLLRAFVVLISAVFYFFLYLFAVEDGVSGSLELRDFDPRARTPLFWLDYGFKITALIAVSLSGALLSRNDRDGKDADDIIEADRWRLGARLIFYDGSLTDRLSIFMQWCVRGAIVLALLTGGFAVLLRLARGL